MTYWIRPDRPITDLPRVGRLAVAGGWRRREWADAQRPAFCQNRVSDRP